MAIAVSVAPIGASAQLRSCAISLATLIAWRTASSSVDESRTGSLRYSALVNASIADCNPSSCCRRVVEKVLPCVGGPREVIRGDGTRHRDADRLDQSVLDAKPALRHCAAVANAFWLIGWSIAAAATSARQPQRARHAHRPSSRRATRFCNSPSSSATRFSTARSGMRPRSALDAAVVRSRQRHQREHDHHRGERAEHDRQDPEQARSEPQRIHRRQARFRRVANVGRIVRHHRQHLDRHHRQQVRQVAAFERGRRADAAVDAIRDRQRRNVDVVADRIGSDDAQLIVVLEEAPRRRDAHPADASRRESRTAPSGSTRRSAAIHRERPARCRLRRPRTSPPPKTFRRSRSRRRSTGASSESVPIPRPSPGARSREPGVGGAAATAPADAPHAARVVRLKPDTTGAQQASSTQHPAPGTRCTQHPSTPAP